MVFKDPVGVPNYMPFTFTPLVVAPRQLLKLSSALSSLGRDAGRQLGLDRRRRRVGGALFEARPLAEARRRERGVMLGRIVQREDPPGNPGAVPKHGGAILQRRAPTRSTRVVAPARGQLQYMYAGNNQNELYSRPEPIDWTQFFETGQNDSGTDICRFRPGHL